MATSISVKDVITDILATGNTPMTLSASVGDISGTRTMTAHDTSNTDYVVPAGKVFQLCYVSLWMDRQCICHLTDSNAIDTNGTLIIPIFYRGGTTGDNSYYFSCYHQVTAGRNITISLASWAGQTSWNLVCY